MFNIGKTSRELPKTALKEAVFSSAKKSLNDWTFMI
mgnify:CR=1 FL=1